MSRTCLSIILAAGMGTRMLSSLPKVLHKIGGLPLVGHIIRTVTVAGIVDIAIVVGYKADVVISALQSLSDALSFFRQNPPLGTAHAVLAARKALERQIDDVLIIFGDTPLVEVSDVQTARSVLEQGADLVVMGFHSDRPRGFGRLIMEGVSLRAIVEERDATWQQKTLTFCNGGMMAIQGKYLLPLLEEVENNTVHGEYYLTDIVALAVNLGLNVRVIEISEENIAGVNTCTELARAEKIWQNRQRQAFMQSGVRLLDPESVFFSYDTKIAADVVIEPYVFFAPGVKVAKGSHIHAFSSLEGTVIAENVQIGPYARLRKGTWLQEGVKIGNFCEIKKAEISTGTKISHLSYIGDASIGANTNIGAGTITCNYDGYQKWKTIIGEGAFIGSNTSLVAPVCVGDFSYIASGSVITEHVAADALAFGRARQITKPQQAKKMREKHLVPQKDI